MHGKDALALAKHSATKWLDDNAPSRAASLSCYTMFSLAPLLIVAVALAGALFGRQAVNGELEHQLDGVLGDSSARAVQDMMASASKPGGGVLATLVGVVALLVGATGAFVELQDTLNTIWAVEKKKISGLAGFVRIRLLSFAMIGLVAFFLLVSLLVSTGLAAFGRLADGRLPGGAIVLHGVDLVVSLTVVAALFASIFKVLPDAPVAWRDVWVGGAVTSVLFTIGKLLIGLYIGKGGVGSSYGAAGSFAVILLWVYYSSMIVFLGAEFTQLYASARAGAGNQPATEAGATRSLKAA
jgi:membrane protein